MAEASKTTEYNKFPTGDDRTRLDRYAFNDLLFKGRHFEAFAVKINSDAYTKEYAKLKYVVCNFAGLISKVCADMLFSEPVKIKVKDIGGDQDFMNALEYDNKLKIQFYESELGNSRRGDALFKVRIGQRNPRQKSTVIIEDISPAIYFPKMDLYNVRSQPTKEELCFKVKIKDKEYLRKEIHEAGWITNELWEMEGDNVVRQVEISLFDPELPIMQETRIDESLLIHVPNWKDGSEYFGYDDYGDITSLIYSLNNRMTKVDNVLDTHSDPILALPEGVLDEKGEVKRSQFQMFEIPNGVGGNPLKPEYITWNANMEAAFKEIEKLVSFLHLFSETSPDVFGMGQGGPDSGRALKLRLLRTIAKVARKKVYYDYALRQTLLIAQKMAKAWNVDVDGIKLGKEPVKPDLEWQDGLPVDMRELVEEEQIRHDTGNTTLEDSIMRLDGVDEDTAKKKAQAIRDEQTIALPTAAPSGAGQPPKTGKVSTNPFDRAGG